MRSVQGIFRCSGGENDETRQNSPVRTPSPPTHRAIFRRPKQGCSPSASSASSEESIIAALPRGPSWPPLTIPESESADTSRLGLSRPIQTGSSVSRHDINASASSERDYRQKPSYYRIQMRNGQAKLASGDDSSVNITDDHNDRIQLTHIQERKHRLTRASNITETSPSSSRSPRRKGVEHQQTWEVHNWEVVGNGQIVAAAVNHPETPGSTSSSTQRKIATSTPDAPKKSFFRSMRTPATPPTKVRKSGNTPESPPRLQKASFDTISTGASSNSGNSFYNEIVDLADPESPPPMSRMSCPNQVLFEDGSKESKSRGSTSGNTEKKDESSCSSGFISQLIDFISFGPCCQMDSMCRGRSSQVVS
mmetsp:Transcript_65/g.144  ORF Transcript_65/g.144 Transcript_65/m.144 type:complete len:365 (-) Transcript_65:72-1166(-)